MKTSQLAIVGTMIVILGGMAVLYLRDRDKLQTYSEQYVALKHQKGDDSAVGRKQMENELLTYKMRVAELEKEVAGLKSKALLADSSTPPELPEYTLTGTKTGSQENAMQAEIERLKVQNQLAIEESGVILDAGIKKKEQEARLAQHISTARTMAKVEEVNVPNYIVVVAPIGQPNFNTRDGEKQSLLVRRDGKVLLKMKVDSLDAQSGKYIAFADSTASKSDVESIKKGDEVIIALEEEAAPADGPMLDQGAPELPAPPAGGKAASSGKGDPGAPELPAPLK